jgi:Tfp pilus assembly protein PilP
MAFELTGTIKEIFDEQTFASGFNKRFKVVVYLVVHVAYGFVAAVRTDELSLLETVEQGRSIVRYMYVQFHKSMYRDEWVTS